jgi:AAA domain/DnaB-like helicase N terminal domain
VEQARKILVTADFYRPAHGVIFDAILAVSKTGTADPVIVNDYLARAGDSSTTGGALYLHTLIASVPVVASAGVYASTVRRHAASRRLRSAGRRILQWTDGPDCDPAALTEQILREVESVRDDGAGSELAQTIYDFLDVPEGDYDYDWVIPDLMERGDRLVLTGVEGGGKSEMSRQLAVMTAAGIHPFSLARQPPARVLLIDAENGERAVRRKIRPLAELAVQAGQTIDAENLRVKCVPGGIDLSTDRGVSWLLREVTAARPDLTLLGPLYKLVPRAIKDDDDAAPVLAALDMVRARGSCIVVEGHAGHALGPGGQRDMRPRGSAALLGWPEFGFGLRWNDESSRMCRVMDVVSWRGERDERMWPEKIMSGGLWPWSECV